jgi:hypothetical protein
VHGFPAVLTSFIGRDGPARELAGLLEEFRLVTVTGPGGALGGYRLSSSAQRKLQCVARVTVVPFAGPTRRELVAA